MKKAWSAWEPLKTEAAPETVKLNVSGREYLFEKSAFPASVKIGGEEFLSQPIKLVGKYSGETFDKLEECEYYLLNSDDERAVFQLSSKMSNTVIDGRITCDFDGFMEICLSIIPFWSFAPGGLNQPKLQCLYIDIPVKSAFSPCYHYWPNDATSIIPSGEIKNSGAIPETGMKLPFKPYVWIGDAFRGIGVSMESDEKLECDGPQIEYIPGDGETILRIHLLDHMPAVWQGRCDRWIDALNPVDYRIGLMATPVKQVSPELKRQWKVFHAFGDMHIGDRTTYLNERPGTLEHLENSGVKWIIFHESSSRVQNYGMFQDEKRFKALIDDCHSHGIKTMVYFGYEFSTLSPTWYEKAGDYLINTVDGHYTGGWQRKPHQRDFMVCYRGGYSHDMIERVKYVMDNFGVDGIYTDGTFVPWECANERHGCGYTDQDGKRHVTYPVFAVREHVRKLYEAVHERGGLIDTHQSSCCIATTLSFCDTYYDGENIQGGLVRSLKEGLTSFLNLPAFRTEYMGKNLGLIDQFIAYSDPAVGWTIEKLSALTLLHDVIPRPRQIGLTSDQSLYVDLDYIEKVWRIFDEFDTAGANWLPYWEKNEIAVSETENAYLSVYQGEKKTLGILSNLTLEPLEVNLCTIYSSARDTLTGKIYLAEKGVIKLTAESYRPYLLDFS